VHTSGNIDKMLMSLIDRRRSCVLQCADVSAARTTRRVNSVRHWCT